MSSYSLVVAYIIHYSFIFTRACVIAGNKIYKHIRSLQCNSENIAEMYTANL